MGSSNDARPTRIADLRVNRLSRPTSVPTATPHFSWRMHSDEQGAYQRSYRLIVETEAGNPVWNSGLVESRDSVGIALGATGDLVQPLTPETRYVWRVEVEDHSGTMCSGTSDFGTGLAGDGIAAWEGARWIGAERAHLDAPSLVVFRLSAEVTVPHGSQSAGIVLGAADFRLARHEFNELGLAGPSSVQFVLDVGDVDAPAFRIHRIGYTADDEPDIPLIEVRADTGSNLGALLGGEFAHCEHHIEIVCWSNEVEVYIDGTALSAAGQTRFVVNPRGNNDVPSFPNLAEIGFVAGPDDRFVVRSLTVRGFRDPQPVLFDRRDFDVFESHEGITVDGDTITVDGGADGLLLHVDPSRGGLPVLRRVIDLESAPAQASLWITARGIYELEINGARVGDDWFNPGSGEYRSTIEYSAYDVAPLLRAGRNVVIARLAPGWWSDMVSFLRVNTAFFGDRPALLGKLVLTHENGRRQVIVTEPGSWQVRTDGPHRSASFFQGERYDARRISAIASEEGWAAAVAVDPLERNANPRLVPKQDPPVRMFETRTATLVGESRPHSDSWIYDLGVNMVGVPEIDLDLPTGAEVVLRTAEMRYPALPVYRDRGIDGLLMTENLREALSTDFYISAGGPATYRPSFTFHGYRFLEVTGTQGPLPEGAVRGIVLSSVQQVTGHVTTSNPEVNQLMENIVRSQLGNFLSVPTDCPQRNERLGWLEAVTEFARTSFYLSDGETFHRHFLSLVRDAQVTDDLLRTKTDLLGFHEPSPIMTVEAQGRATPLFTAPVVPGMYPSYVPAYDAYRSWGTPWSSAGVLVPYELYRQYGSLDVVRESFESMKTYLEAMADLRIDGCSALSADGGSCGDWLSLDKPPFTFTDATVYSYTLRCFAEMAEAIGESAVAMDYTRRWDAARTEWNELYLDPDTGRFREDDPALVITSQSSCALALHYGLPFEQYRAALAAALRETVIAGYDGTPYAITTGLFTTPLINLALSDTGSSDLAYAMLENRQFPSWLYPVTQGATSMWERWNSFTLADGFGGNNAMNSFNHFSLGGVGAWVFSRVLGIDRTTKAPGMQHFLIHPEPGGTITSVDGSVETDYGRIDLRWNYTDAAWHARVAIPANSGATIELPWARSHDGGPTSFDVVSGTWHIVVDAEGAHITPASSENSIARDSPPSTV